MAYTTLTKHEQHRMIVDHYCGTEAAIHSHTLNVDRYERMLAAGGMSPEFTQRIRDLLISERRALAENTAIAEATKTQLPEPHIVRAILAARTAEIAAQSPAPAERASAIAASDKAWAESIPTIAFLKSTLKSQG